MSTDDAATLRDRIDSWLSAQMPMIDMHGGTSAVREVDLETGRVVVELGGACSGCGISQTTEQTLDEELVAQFDAIETVSVQFLGEESGGWGTGQAETYMGIDRNEGGRGGKGEGSPVSDFF